MTNESALILSRNKQTEIIDPSEWRVTKSVIAFGVRVGLRTNKAEVLDDFSEYLPPLWRPSTGSSVDRMFSLRIGKAVHALFEDLEMTIKSRSLNRVLEDFGARVKAYVAEMARRRVFIHAGAVGWRGKAIVIPGRSMSGKTSLVRELVRAGATYYSDEYAVLDMHGRVHPYPQPLALRTSGSFVQRKLRVEELGGVAGDKPLPVGLVIVSPYQAAARWRPRRLSIGQGMLELLSHTVPARRKPEIVMPTLQQAVAEATVLKGARGEAAETVGLILKRVESF